MSWTHGPVSCIQAVRKDHWILGHRSGYAPSSGSAPEPLHFVAGDLTRGPAPREPPHECTTWGLKGLVAGEALKSCCLTLFRTHLRTVVWTSHGLALALSPGPTQGPTYQILWTHSWDPPPESPLDSSSNSPRPSAGPPSDPPWTHLRPSQDLPLDQSCESPPDPPMGPLSDLPITLGWTHAWTLR